MYIIAKNPLGSLGKFDQYDVVCGENIGQITI